MLLDQHSRSAQPEAMDHHFMYPKVSPVAKGAPWARGTAEFRTVRPSQRDLVRASLLRSPERPSSGK
jgi:hypothetical protein